GTSPSTPWLTFDYALSSGRAWCGNTLVLLDGTYGDGTSTGKISVQGANCTSGSVLTIMAQNSRQALIRDDGTGRAVDIQNSAYVIVDGLYARSVDRVGVVANGGPFRIKLSNHVTIRNSIGVNPNRYANVMIFSALNSQDLLFEGNEGYFFHRHCITGWESERIVVRRQYCNPRNGGKIPGGFSAGGASLGTGDAVFSMYPCRDCILENSIGEGAMFLNEMNATYHEQLIMSAKILGSICIGCSAGNGIYLNSRRQPDLNHTPQNILIENTAIVDFRSRSSGIRASDAVNLVVQNVTIAGADGQTGISLDDTAYGATGAQQSATVRDSVVMGMNGTGLNQEAGSYNTLVTSNLYSYNNRPASSGSWGSVSTNNPGMGSCKVFIPENSPLKRAGTNGGDIGANVLCRYENGVLTQTQLWNWQTGQFPCGAIVAGVNDVAGSSCSDVHRRLNVNTNGCNLPATPSCRQPAPPNFPSIPPSGGFVPPILRGPDGEVCPSGF
ncbi:MAG: hypothetical protein AABY33_08315, partial [Pseudomonadota bacterium]